MLKKHQSPMLTLPFMRKKFPPSRNFYLIRIFGEFIGHTKVARVSLTLTADGDIVLFNFLNCEDKH